MTKYLETDYWEGADYIKWPEENLAMFNLSKNDIKALTELGLPEWVAPNINFDHFELEPDTLKLGEDREDRDIYMLRGSSRILVGNNGMLFNSSPENLRKALQFYAIMVEKAILIDDEALVENRIEEALIDELQEELLKLDPDSLHSSSFWFNEINRLRSRR